MQDLNRFFVNPFLDKEISRDEIVAFTADTLARLNTQNTAGLYDTTLATLGSLFATLGGTLSSEAVASGVQAARTAAMVQRRRETQAVLSSFEGLVHSKLKRKTPEYIALFPAGLKEFDSATTDQFSGKVEALLTRADAYKTQLGAPEIARVEASRLAFATVRGEQLAKKAGTGTAAGLRKAADKSLREELFQALLLVASKNPNQPAKATLYFKQSLLEDPTKQAEEDPAKPA